MCAHVSFREKEEKIEWEGEMRARWVACANVPCVASTPGTARMHKRVDHVTRLEKNMVYLTAQKIFVFTKRSRLVNEMRQKEKAALHGF